MIDIFQRREIFKANFLELEKITTDQQKIDELLKLDGNDEFVVYISPVGKLK